MRIMLDTNVLISLFLFPSSRMNSMMDFIFSEHELVLSSYVVDELKDVVRRKFPAKEPVVDRVLTAMSYDLVYTPEKMEKGLFDIRDTQDYPVLYTAVVEDVDILITGDKDFAEVDIEKPEIMTPADFCEQYLPTED